MAKGRIGDVLGLPFYGGDRGNPRLIHPSDLGAQLKGISKNAFPGVFLVDESLVAAIAAEHRKGRRLYVGTTHVYAGRPMIWDIGGIAASGRPDATALVRKVLLASTAVPAMLPPVYFDVVAGGRKYHEMHVDGGIARAVFIGPPGIDWAALAQADTTARPARFHVIRNGRARGEYMIMQPRVLQLAQHGMMQLTQSLGVGDLYRIYVDAQRHGVDYRAAWIGDDFDAPWEDWEGAGYMRALFDYGHRLAVDGKAWHAQPPGPYRGGTPPTGTGM
jgi:hypothetical protein